MRSKPTLGWGLVAVAVFGWHLLWWGLIKAQDIPEPLSSKASNIRYLPVPNDDKDPRLKEILAPLIFSTPSIAGFSQPLLEKEAESVPPLRVVRDLSIKLDREPSGVTREHTVSSSDFQSEVKKQLDEFIFVMPEEDPYRAQQPVNGIELKWEGDLDQERIKYAEANPDWLAITNTSWEAVVHLRFGSLHLRPSSPGAAATPTIPDYRSVRPKAPLTLYVQSSVEYNIPGGTYSCPTNDLKGVLPPNQRPYGRRSAADTSILTLRPCKSTPGASSAAWASSRLRYLVDVNVFA